MLIKIYKIVNDINDDIYVGSTKSPLAKRIYSHKLYSKKNPTQNNLYQFVNENGWGCCRIVLIEEVECKSNEEKLRAEQKYIDELKPKMNKINAFSKCEHGKNRWFCKDCGGSQVCEHDRNRSECKDCGGGHICEHSKRRSQCKDCGGSQICEHDRRRSRCKDCGGGHICEHNRARSQCKDCGGSQICEHDRRRSYCKECGASQTKKIKCETCNCEVRKDVFKNHLKSKKHQNNLQNSQSVSDSSSEI